MDDIETSVDYWRENGKAIIAASGGLCYPLGNWSEVCMTCPKCNAEQPDNAKFCSQCAAPLAEPVITVAKSKVPTWLSVLLFIPLALIVIAVWHIIQQNARLR